MAGFGRSLPKALLLAALSVLLRAACCQEELGSNGICPPAESIKPCVCYALALDHPLAECNNLTSVGQLRKAVGGMKGFKMTEMVIASSRLEALPSDAFRGVLIEALFFQNSELPSLGDGPYRPPFLGQEDSLRLLQIDSAFVAEQAPMPRLALSHLKRLHSLELSNNAIPEIGNDWFESGPYGLKELFVSKAGVRRLGSRAFASLSNLRKLAVTGGSLAQVTRAMFPQPAHYLQVIQLGSNELRALPADLFSAMPSLEEVRLESNALAGLDERAWAAVWSGLSLVDLTGNPVQCEPDLKWVYKYRLPELLRGRCAGPPALAGRELSKLQLRDFA